MAIAGRMAAGQWQRSGSGRMGEGRLRLTWTIGVKQSGTSGVCRRRLLVRRLLKSTSVPAFDLEELKKDAPDSSRTFDAQTTNKQNGKNEVVELYT